MYTLNAIGPSFQKANGTPFLHFESKWSLISKNKWNPFLVSEKQMAPHFTKQMAPQYSVKIK